MASKAAGAQNSKKRSAPWPAAHPSRPPKLAKMLDARKILTQTSEPALDNATGELDVASFVKAREFEIRALENTMAATKRTAATRAFQHVPREMRRRTASHNVKRVPRRLKARAAKEMREDNTPTVTARRRDKTPRQHLRAQNAKKIPEVAARMKHKREKASRREEAKAEYEARWNNAEDKDLRKEKRVPVEKTDYDQNALAAPKPSIGKHKKRQLDKSWLPTHLFHTKRAHMTPPKEPLWRFSIPLTPTPKNYRITHRASTLRGCIAWDLSYVSTIRLEGKEASLLDTFQALGIREQWIHGRKCARWRSGERSLFEWVREEQQEQKWIAKALIVWKPQLDGESKRSVLVRIQPAAFLHLWEELMRVGKKRENPITLEDLRFEMGSIDITGPGSMEALVGILRPISDPDSKDGCGQEAVAHTWTSIAPITDSFALPPGAMLGLSVKDPRLGAPHRTLEKPHLTMTENVLRLISEWPAKETCINPSFFSRKLCLEASHKLRSQRSINRRKGEALPGEHPPPLPADPEIPILLVANNHDKKGCAQGSWTLLVPRKFVLPVWYTLMHYPLSSGGNPRFGGLNEQRQMCFENNKPWFPGDFPGTKAGWLWELQEREKRKKEWERKPKGRRIEFESVRLGDGRKGELGRGWACDWERLFSLESARQTRLSEKETSENALDPAQNSDSAQDPAPPNIPSSNICHLPTPTPSLSSTPPQALVTVSIRLVHRGIPKTCARIYRLPTSNPSLRSAWLALSARNPTAPSCAKPAQNKNKHTTSKNPSGLPSSESISVNRPTLAAALLKNTAFDSPEPPQAGDSDYPPSPNEEDLIGFVTTGSFNLGEGRGTGLGCVAWRKVLEGNAIETSGGKGKGGVKGEDGEIGGWCVVREAGSGIGRIAWWRVVG